MYSEAQKYLPENNYMHNVVLGCNKSVAYAKTRMERELQRSCLTKTTSISALFFLHTGRLHLWACEILSFSLTVSLM